MTLLEQAVSIAGIAGDIEPAAEARSWLARARLQLGDPGAAALTAAAAGRELPYPAGEPALLLEGLALLGLHRPEESVQAFSGALAAADALLALADSNVAALQARALALAGLAAAGDPGPGHAGRRSPRPGRCRHRRSGRGRRHPPPARSDRLPRPVRMEPGSRAAPDP